MEERLISKYRLEMGIPACTSGAGWSVMITFDDDISEALPYLNAELDGCRYYHDGAVLIRKAGGKRFAFRSNRIEIAPLESRDEAEQACRETLDLVEDIWRRRDRITPDLATTQAPPSLLAVLRLLPGDNCTECGCLTCMAYAAALIQGQSSLLQCTALSGQSLAELEDMLGEGVA